MPGNTLLWGFEHACSTKETFLQDFLVMLKQMLVVTESKIWTMNDNGCWCGVFHQNLHFIILYNTVFDMIRITY